MLISVRIGVGMGNVIIHFPKRFDIMVLILNQNIFINVGKCKERPFLYFKYAKF